MLRGGFSPSRTVYRPVIYKYLLNPGDPEKGERSSLSGYWLGPPLIRPPCVLPFFRSTFVIRPPQIASSSFTPSIACSALSGIHSDSHSESTHAFAPLREVATRRFRQPIADIGHVKGWLHWRLLGALIAGDARTVDIRAAAAACRQATAASAVA